MNTEFLTFDETGRIVTVCDESPTSVVIPEGVTEIGEGEFRGCSALTSIKIPNSVTKIGGLAFSRCSALTSIEIPNSVTEIGSFAFANCSALTSIEIPNSVTKIGEEAFENCFSLKEFHVRWEHPEDMEFESNVFKYISPDCILYVPIGTGYAYRHHEAFKGKFKEVRTES